MKVTAIKQQQKRQDRYSIYIDEKYTFSLGEDELAVSGLYKDQELSIADVEAYKQTSVVGKAYDRVIRYLALRPRSQWEIEDYLHRKGYDESVTKTVIERITSKGYINDEQFSKSWVESRQLLNPRSKRRLRLELRKKRVADEIIDQVISEISEEAELTQVINIIEKKRKVTRYQDDQKLIAYLARQGYNYDLIKEALQ